ncbi:hypothetical protein [Escherichia phage pEC-M719-6WT.1]|uniref:Uncharacterized protein n=1 Tax=Escherichia phage pEC-M719-6WT.1 TaxID=3056220 RepID=A0AA51YF90_9CAUD|nr:hypothetical protein [Escherichia phage pEC-M719-6WT.1]
MLRPCYNLVRLFGVPLKAPVKGYKELYSQLGYSYYGEP